MISLCHIKHILVPLVTLCLMTNLAWAEEQNAPLGSNDWDFAVAKAIALDFANHGKWARACIYLYEIAEKTQDWNVLLVWSRVKIQLGDMVTADKAIKLALKQAPENPRILFTAGDIATDLNHPDEALLFYEKALALQPDQTYAAMILGRLYAKQNEWEKLIPIYERIVQTTTPTPEVWIRLAVAHEQAGNIKRAEICYREYANLSTNRAIGLSQLLVFYERIGQTDKASEVKKKLSSLGQGDQRNLRALMPSAR